MTIALPKFLKRAFCSVPIEHALPEKPDDTGLDDKLAQATHDHRLATVGVRRAALRQVHDAGHIREAMRGVLNAIEERKARDDG